MNTKTVHTATPWEQDGLSILKRNGLGEVIHVAEVRDTSPLLADGDAAGNAAFIVRACNAHDDLVRELAKARSMLARAACAGDDDIAGFDAAIAAAEQE